MLGDALYPTFQERKAHVRAALIRRNNVLLGAERSEEEIEEARGTVFHAMFLRDQRELRKLQLRLAILDDATWPLDVPNQLLPLKESDEYFVTIERPIVSERLVEPLSARASAELRAREARWAKARGDAPAKKPALDERSRRQNEVEEKRAREALIKKQILYRRIRLKATAEARKARAAERKAEGAERQIKQRPLR
jgi:hypothetical protein